MSSTNSNSCCGGFCGSIIGAIIGIVLIPVGCWALFTNEARAVKTADSLKSGSASCVTVDAGKIDPANDGKLVYVAGNASTDKPLTDPVFKLTMKAIKLDRKVEMYEWSESSHTYNNSTNYTYNEGWDDHYVDLNSFHYRDGHVNPKMPIETKEFVADDVKVGAYKLGSDLVSQVSNSSGVDIGPQSEHPAHPSDSWKPLGESQLYSGGDPSTPHIGDLRVTFTAVEAGAVSVVAGQKGDTLTGFGAGNGDSPPLIEQGTVPVQTMFKNAEKHNQLVTWLWRLGGFLAVFIGFALIAAPLDAVVRVIPIFGELIEMGTVLFALILGVVVSAITIAIGWVHARPIYGIGAIAIAVVILIAFVMHGRGRRTARLGAQ